MIRGSFGWVLGAALLGCTPIYTQPDAGPINDLLVFRPEWAKPRLGVLPTDVPLLDGGACTLHVSILQVASSSPDAGALLLGAAYLNVDSDPPPAISLNAAPLPLFSQLAFTPDGPQTGTPALFGYSLKQLPLVINLNSLLFWLFPRTDPRTNYLTLRVTDGVTTLDLIWGLDLSPCDPRPF